MTARSESQSTRARRIAFTVWVAILSLLFSAFIGVTALTVGMWLADPSYEETNPLVDLGLFALGAVLIGTGFAVVLITLLASTRTGVWRVSAWSAGVAAAILGLASIALPDVPGSFGPAWGALATVWSLFVVAAAEWQVRRNQTEGHPQGGQQP